MGPKVNRSLMFPCIMCLSDPINSILPRYSKLLSQNSLGKKKLKSEIKSKILTPFDEFKCLVSAACSFNILIPNMYKNKIIKNNIIHHNVFEKAQAQFNISVNWVGCRPVCFQMILQYRSFYFHLSFCVQLAQSMLLPNLCLQTQQKSDFISSVMFLYEKTINVYKGLQTPEVIIWPDVTLKPWKCKMGTTGRYDLSSSVSQRTEWQRKINLALSLCSLNEIR